jgi:hypothetical protein
MAEKRQLIAWLLGNYLDGWADLIEGMGAKAESVKNAVVKQLTDREMPEIKVEEVTIREGIFSSLVREYNITATFPGARTTIFIQKHGKDLFASWRSFVRPTLNWTLLLIFLIISFFTALLINGFRWLYGVYLMTKLIISSQDTSPVIQALGHIVLYGALIFVVGICLVGLFGVIKKKSFATYLNIWVFVILFVASFAIVGFIELIHFYSIYKQTYGLLSLPFTGVFFTTFYIFLGYIFLAMLVGLIFRRSPLVFLFREPSIFDAEDITAMNLSVHKSMLRALDQEGIDSSKLRLKGEFKGGRRQDIL